MRLAVYALLIIAAAVALSSWTGQSLSQAPPATPQTQPPPQPAQQPEAFRLPAPPLVAAIDANGDGEVSAEEINAAADALKKLDKNTDGELDDEEIRPAQPFPGFGGRGPGGRGARGGRGGPGGFGRQSMKVLERFDEDKDGMLSQPERAKARVFAKENRPAGGRFGRGPGPGGPGGPGGAPGQANNAARQAGERLSPDDVAKYPDAKLYDPHVLRTLFFEFENQDWEEELEDFHNTDVEVPAKLVVDGKAYDNVGVRFRGTSSYGGVPRGQKRSLNITMDLVDGKQNLLGHKTLNLLNSHTDPSFLRTILFSHIARNYIPAPEANLVRVVINGESWGIYVSEEQYNKDFVKKWFGNGDGPRWKVPPNFSGDAALVYHGDNAEDYQGLYEIKAKDEKQAWQDLIALCKKLDELPDDKLEAELGRVLDIDRALWFLAIDNVLIDEDGYFSRGSDYSIYQDPEHKRFHLMPRDSNETFRYHGGGPGFGGRGGGRRGGGPGEAAQRGGARGDGPAEAARRGGAGADAAGGAGRGPAGPGGPGREPGERGATQDPLAQIDADNRPLVRRLMANKHLRARYLAHVRTIVDEWLHWEAIGPIFENHRALIADDVMRDTRNLSTFADFFDADIAGASGGGPFGGPPGLKRFVEERRAYLLKHPELVKPAPKIIAVDRRSPAGEPAAATGPGSKSNVEVVARVSNETPVESVLLYYAVGRGAPFQHLEMKADANAGDSGKKETTYAAAIPAAIPAAPSGADVYYYVEARAESDVGTTTFSPARAEFASLHYRVAALPTALIPAKSLPAKSPAAAKTPMLAINEVMAANNRTIKDPQGKFADWIELANTGKDDIDLSGIHLSDDKSKARKWTFPDGTKLAAGGHLIVWADEGGKAAAGLHANFKLAKGGEMLLLIDRDDRGNTLIDSLDFGEQRADIAFGRYPDGAGKWQLLPPTPGAPNAAPN